jgi:leader peptidase (prepilin peptidase)/N-methyltransferase
VFEGAAVGVAVMLLSMVTKGSIGMGDGIILLCTGAVAGFEKNMELFFSALILCGMCGLFLVLILRKSRKTKVPFVPFLLAAFGIMEIVSLGGGLAI